MDMTVTQIGAVVVAELHAAGYMESTIGQYAKTIKALSEFASGRAYSVELGADFASMTTSVRTGRFSAQRRFDYRRLVGVFDSYVCTGQVDLSVRGRGGGGRQPVVKGFVELDAAWEVEMERRGLAAATRAAYGRVARSYLVFLEGCGIVELGDADGASVLVFLESLLGKWAKSSLFWLVSNFRPFLKFTGRSDLVDALNLAGVKRSHAIIPVLGDADEGFFGRRPDRFASASDAAPGTAHQRRRHLRTVSSHIPSHRAICAFDSPAEAASTIWARITSRCSVRPARVIGVSSRRCEPVNVIRSVLVGNILVLHDEFPLATPASPVTSWMVVNDTPIRQDHDHGRTAHVDENVPATAAVSPRPRTMAANGRCRVRFRGAFAYVTANMPDGDSMPLMRLRYGGSAARWGFAVDLASKDGYEDSVLPTGDLAGAPEDALDTACGLYLGDPTAWA